MSDTQRWFVGGQQKLMPELLAMVAPTVNSYRRLIPGFWAPTDSAWSVDNRTTSLRVIPGSPKSQRIEYRIAAADANPYVILSAALASGFWGIENRVEPEPMVEGNAYEKKFPEYLRAAAHIVGGGAAPEGIENGARLVRRRVRRSLCRDARVGGARVPPPHKRLGTRALLRDHLTTQKTISPVDGSVYCERELDTDAAVDEEAVRLMNDSPYGLTAAVWTSDPEAALAIGARVETGTWFMNRCDYLDPALAWVGVKDSGRGCTLSRVGYEHLTRPKSYHLRLKI